MGRKNSRNTKGRIISAAWKLFHDQGFDNTTIEDIVFESATSKGSFYHYFESKDALMGTLSDMFDEKYESLMQTMNDEQDAVEKLIWLNHELFAMIDESVSVDILSRLLASQVLGHGNASLLDHSRVYFRVLKKIISEGQKKDVLTSELSIDQITKDYAMMERALMYDWCLSGGDYELAAYSSRLMPAFLNQYRK